MATATEILFTKIETAPSWATWEEVPEDFKNLWLKQVFQSYRDFIPNTINYQSVPEHVAISLFAEKAAFHAEFSRIVTMSLGMLVADHDSSAPPALVVKAVAGSELTILNTFAAACTRAKALCSHAGKGIIFPFIARRTIINGLILPTLLNVGNIKPWENPNVDTQDLWQFGGHVYPSMELMCKVLNIPMDRQLESSQVPHAFYQNKIEEIKTACSQDVVSLARLYVKLVGNVSIDTVVVK